MEEPLASSLEVENAAHDLLAAVKRARQYLVLAVQENTGALRKIAERDLGMLDAALSKATSSSAAKRSGSTP